MPERRELGFAGAGFGVVAGAALVVYSVAGVVHERDQWKAQALTPRPPATVTASPSTTQAAVPSSSSPAGLPGFRAQPVTARSAAPSGPAPAPVTHPTARPTTPRPTPTPAPPPTRSCPSALVTVTLTVRCPLLQIGGS